MHELYTTIGINAPRHVVWGVLTDLPRYGEWNPYIPRISGDLTPGKRLRVHASPSGTIGRTFFPEVLKVDGPNELRWVGRLPLPGLFNGEHIFTLEARGDDAVHFIHREEFSGLITPVHKRFRLTAAKRGFEEMNVALKTRAEAVYQANTNAP